MDPLEAAFDQIKPEAVVLPCLCDALSPKSTDCQTCECLLDHIKGLIQRKAIGCGC
jgi:hypothetical protein